MKEKKVRMLLELLPGGAVIRLKEETLVECLMQKQLGMSHPCAELISEVNIFDHEPSQLPALSELETKSDQWYFFYHRSLLHKNGKVWKRRTGEGGWHETGDPKKVIDVVTRRILVFMEGPYNGGRRTGWTLHEFETGDRSDLVVGCLMKNPVKPVKRKKASGKGELDDKLVKRKQNSSKRDLGDDPGSASDNQFVGSKYDPGCLTENPAKRTRTFDGGDLDDYQSSISEVPEVLAEEETNQDLYAQFPCATWSEQSKERYLSTSSFNSDHSTLNHKEMQSQFYTNSAENIASKVQQGDLEFPGQPTYPPREMQSTERFSLMHSPSSSGSAVNNMELQMFNTSENSTQKDIVLQEVNQEPPTQMSFPRWPMQTGERHTFSNFSTSGGSTINCHEKENYFNTMGETTLEVSAINETPGASAGDVNLEPPFSPIFSPPRAHFCSSFSCDEWQFTVSTHAEYEGQLKLWEPSHFDKHEPFDNESISKLPNDTRIVPPLGNDLDDITSWIDDFPIQAIGGLPSNSA